MGRRWLLLAAAVALWGCGGSGESPSAAAPGPGAPSVGGFAAIEAEILVPRCSAVGCHGGARPAGQLDLSAGRSHGELVGVASARRPERLLVAPGNPDGSYLLERLAPGGDTPLMPLGAPRLSEEELERLREWIREGAHP
ncbi:MAG: hypothetical protein SCH98_13765 [Deferrisomatales bacterium]|nr:hypothetical protein [Deferrisomatales bacterium]